MMPLGAFDLPTHYSILCNNSPLGLGDRLALSTFGLGETQGAGMDRTCDQVNKIFFLHIFPLCNYFFWHLVGEQTPHWC